jgi:hypothetical protein
MRTLFNDIGLAQSQNMATRPYNSTILQSQEVQYDACTIFANILELEAEAKIISFKSRYFHMKLRKAYEKLIVSYRTRDLNVPDRASVSKAITQMAKEAFPSAQSDENAKLARDRVRYRIELGNCWYKLWCGIPMIIVVL